MSIETIKIESNGKFGPKVNGQFYSFSKFYKGNRELPVGSTVEVDVFTSDSGKKYINAVLGEAVAPVKAVTKQAPKAAKVLDNTMSKDEWAAKDVRISRQGVIQVAVQVTSNFEEAVILADKMLAYVNQKNG